MTRVTGKWAAPGIAAPQCGRSEDTLIERTVNARPLAIPTLYNNTFYPGM